MKTGANRLRQFEHAERRNNDVIVKATRKSRNKG